MDPILGVVAVFLVALLVVVIVSRQSQSLPQQTEPLLELEEGDHFVILGRRIRKLEKYERDPEAHCVLSIGKCRRYYKNRPHAMFVKVMDPRVIEMTHVVDLATREVLARNVD